MGSLEEYWKYRYHKCWKRLCTLFVLLAVAAGASTYHMQHHDIMLFVDLAAVTLIVMLLDKVARKIKNLNNTRPPGI